VAEDGANGGSDFSWREGAGGDLLEEVLEEVEVALVEEGDVHVGALEGLCGDQACEASAEDQDAVWRRHGGFLLLFGGDLMGSLGPLGTLISRT